MARGPFPRAYLETTTTLGNRDMRGARLSSAAARAHGSGSPDNGAGPHCRGGYG